MGARQELKQEAALVASYTERMIMCPSKKFKKICVFCGSSSGKKGVFSNEALNLGRELVCMRTSSSFHFLTEDPFFESKGSGNCAGESKNRLGVWRWQHRPHGPSSADSPIWRRPCSRVNAFSQKYLTPESCVSFTTILLIAF